MDFWIREIWKIENVIACLNILLMRCIKSGKSQNFTFSQKSRVILCLSYKK